MFSSMEKIRKRSCTPSNCLKGVSIVIALTTALVSPLVDAFAIKFHQEDVVSASAVSIKGALRVASQPGMAVHIHLRKLVRWAVWCHQMRMEI